LNPVLFWVVGVAFAAVVITLVWGYRRLARRAELDAAERALSEEYAELEERQRPRVSRPGR
jgi:hypothetical protein